MDIPEEIKQRIDELLEVANQMYPNNPEWYNRLCVTNYVAQEEYPEYNQQVPDQDKKIVEECSDETHK